MNKEERKKLRELIKKGKWNFVLTRGVFYFGGGFFLIFFLPLILFEKFILDTEVYIGDIGVFVILSVLGGLIFGFVCWIIMNKKLNKK